MRLASTRDAAHSPSDDWLQVGQPGGPCGGTLGHNETILVPRGGSATPVTDFATRLLCIKALGVGTPAMRSHDHLRQLLHAIRPRLPCARTQAGMCSAPMQSKKASGIGEVSRANERMNTDLLSSTSTASKIWKEVCTTRVSRPQRRHTFQTVETQRKQELASEHT